jgi:hypothetical protein
MGIWAHALSVRLAGASGTSGMRVEHRRWLRLWAALRAGAGAFALMSAANPSSLTGANRSSSEGRGPACWCLPPLTYRQRLIGCAFCFTSGLMLLATSLLSLTSLLLGNPAPFAVKYTRERPQPHSPSPAASRDGGGPWL